MNRRSVLIPDVTADRQVIDIFLSPGELYFGDSDTRIRTVLGSCVSVTLWHPQHRIGGMCHFMLPSRLKSGRDLDGRYGEEAFALLRREIKRAGTRCCEYQAKVFGGGNMFPQAQNGERLEVGARNIELALSLIESHRFQLKSKHLAGFGHRNVVFEVWSGDVWLRHGGA